MRKVVRNFIDRQFLARAQRQLLNFQVRPSLSWCGLVRGATLRQLHGRSGPAIFVFINYGQDREYVAPYLAWSSTSMLPSEDVEHTCLQLARSGSSLSDLLAMPQGLLDPSLLTKTLRNCFESRTPTFPQEYAELFLSDERVRSFLQLYTSIPLNSSSRIPSPDEPEGIFFSFDSIASIAPELLTDDRLAFGYGSILDDLKVWLAEIAPHIEAIRAHWPESDA